MAELPERLRNAAGAHRPDRERMLARVERAIASPEPARGRRERPGVAPWTRVTAVAAAVAGAIGLGGLAVGAVSGSGGPRQSVVTSADSELPPPPPAGLSTSGAGATHRPPGPHPRRLGARRTTGPATRTPMDPPTPRATRTSSFTAVTPPPATGGTEDPPPSSPAPRAGGGVTASAALDARSTSDTTQSDVTLTNSAAVTALSVELRIARTSGVADAGSWTSVPDKVTASVDVTGAYLVYRWVLHAGESLDPGTYVFAGRFGHAEGERDTSGDTYAAAVLGEGGPATLSGGF